MNNFSNKCSICGSKGRRLCSATGNMICTTCCGSKRGTKISCTAGCKFYPFSINGYELWLKTDGTLAHKMLDYAVANYGKDKLKGIIDRMTFNDENREEIQATTISSAIYYVLFIERDSNRKTLAEKWKTEGWLGLNNDERKMMECRTYSSVTIVEIQRVLDHQTMECIDLLDEERGKFIVLDRNTAARAIRFTRLLTWLTHFPHFSRLANNGIEIPDMVFHEFKETLIDKFNREKSLNRKNLTIKEYLSENFGSFCKLPFDLAHEKQLTMLNKMDMHQCKGFYEVHENKFDEIKAILDTYPDFEARERHRDEIELSGTYYYDWLRRGKSKELEKEMLPAFRHEDASEGIGGLGDVSLYPNELIIETFSKQRYTFAKKMVDKYFGGLVTLKNEEIIDVAKQMAQRIEEGKEEARPSIGEQAQIPLEIQEKIMKDFYKKNYEKFLNDEIPALDGMTPRQAAKDLAMRQKLIDLIKEHLKGIEMQNRSRNLGLDISWVLDELELSELK